jgi:hypothetical protein
VLSFILRTSRATSASIARFSWASTSVISTFSSLLLLLPEPAAVGLLRAAFSAATVAALSAASAAFFLLLVLLLFLLVTLTGAYLGLGTSGVGEGGGVVAAPPLLLLSLLLLPSLLLVLLLAGESDSSGCTGVPSLLAVAAGSSTAVTVVDREVCRVSLKAQRQMQQGKR